MQTVEYLQSGEFRSLDSLLETGDLAVTTGQGDLQGEAGGGCQPVSRTLSGQSPSISNTQHSYSGHFGRSRHVNDV